MTAQGLFFGVKVYLIDFKSVPDVSNDCCTHRNLNSTVFGPAAYIFGPTIGLKFTIFVLNDIEHFHFWAGNRHKIHDFSPQK